MSFQGLSQCLLNDHVDCEKCLRTELTVNVIFIFKKGKKDSGSYRLVNHSSIPVKVIEEIIQIIHLQACEGQERIKSSQHGF